MLDKKFIAISGIWQCHIIMASQNQSLLKIFSFEKQVLELAEVRLTIVQQIYRVYHTYIHIHIYIYTLYNPDVY